MTILGTPLFVLLCSGEHEKIQLAAMVASLAAVSDRPVHVLVSMNALFAFAKEASADERYQGGAFSALMKERGVPDAIDVFTQGKDLGELSLHVCSMALDVSGWQEDDLIEGLFDGVMGLTKFLSDAETGQLITL